MQMTRQFIYLFIVFVVSVVVSSCSRKKPQHPRCVASPAGPMHRYAFMQQLPAVTSLLEVEVSTFGVGQCTCPMTPRQFQVFKCTAVRGWCEPLPPSHTG